MLTWPTCGQSGYVTTARGSPAQSPWTQGTRFLTSPTCGQNGYIRPTVLGVPNAEPGIKFYKWLPGPNVGNVAASPLHSYGLMGPQRFCRKKNQKWLLAPHVGKLVTPTLLSQASTTLSAWTKISTTCSIAGAGLGGTPRGRSSTCEQRDHCPTLTYRYVGL